VGLTSTPTTTPADSLRVHPTVERPTRTATIDGETREIAIDSRRGVIYIAQGNEKRLAVFSMATMRVTATLPLPGVPMDLDLTPGGDSLAIAVYGQRALAIVDLRQPTLALSWLPLAALDSSSGQYASRVRVLSNGHAFLSLAGNIPSAWTLMDVDLATGAQRVRSDAAVNGVVGDVYVGRSLDGSVLVVNMSTSCLRRYVAATDVFNACVKPRVYDWQPTVDATGQRFAIGSDIYDASMQLLPKLGPNLTPGGIANSALSADGQSLFQMLWNPGIVRLNAADGRILDKTSMPVQINKPPHVSPDGNTLVLIDRENTTTSIAVIDLR
jgi:hypothetical protein